jgi:hypothetical protein
MPLNPSGAISLGGPTAGQSIAVELGLSPTASISLNQTDVRTLAGVPSGTIIMPTNFWGKSNLVYQATVRGLMMNGTRSDGETGSRCLNLANSIVMNNLGDYAGLASVSTTPKQTNFGCVYGGDKGIAAYGATRNPPSPCANATMLNTQNLVTNTGVIGADTATNGTPRTSGAASAYGLDKAIFAFGQGAGPTFSFLNIRNLVSNTGVMASDSPGVGTARTNLAAAPFGGNNGQAIFFAGATGAAPLFVSTANTVSNTGVVGSDTPTAGTARISLVGMGYGGDKAVFATGRAIGPSATRLVNGYVSNLVSNTGVVASNTTIPFSSPAFGQEYVYGLSFGGGQALFAMGNVGNMTTLGAKMTNTGVWGLRYAWAPATGRGHSASVGYSFT